MEPTFSVDLISNLNLTADQEFNWEGKPTSLFCVVAGNISSDLNVIKSTLDHLSSYYRGVMYIDGSLEHPDIKNFNERVEQIRQICLPMTNVIYLHNHVVVLNGVAFVAVNGWLNKNPQIQEVYDLIRLENLRVEDLAYLSKTLKTLQRHHDAKKIVVISSSTPCNQLFFSKDSAAEDNIEPNMALAMDTEEKVNIWLYGGTNTVSDQQIENTRYVNNPCDGCSPYWPKHVFV